MSELEGSQETPGQSVNTQIGKLRPRGKGKWVSESLASGVVQPPGDPGQVHFPLCALRFPPTLLY